MARQCQSFDEALGLVDRSKTLSAEAENTDDRKTKLELLDRSHALLTEAKRYIDAHPVAKPKKLVFFHTVKIDDRPVVNVLVRNCPQSVVAARRWHHDDKEDEGIPIMFLAGITDAFLEILHKGVDPDMPDRESDEHRLIFSGVTRLKSTWVMPEWLRRAYDR